MLKNVGLQSHERDVTRFLWLKNTSESSLDNSVQIYRFFRVPFGVISSPFLLGATIANHLQNSDNPIAKDLQRDLYVDNLITGISTVDEAKLLYTHAKNLFETALMNLREWESNCKIFEESIPLQDKVTKADQKVLGVYWNSVDDMLSISKIGVELASTKREVLKHISLIFDPLGYFPPTILRAKLFMKKLRTDKCDWDERISDEYVSEWKDISEQLERISAYHLLRYIGITAESNSVQYRLVCFCGASAVAYATVVYLHQSAGDTYKTDLLFSKTRLAPHGTTIPRLELLGVLIGVRALTFLCGELCLQVSCHLFTDSLCVLYWLRTTKLLSVFVANRVKEIQSLEGLTFAHVASNDNPADMATRGKPPDELSTSMWWKGPPWLASPNQLWPNHEPVMDEFAERDSEREVKGSKVLYEAKLVAGEDPMGKSVKGPDLSDIDERRHSSLYKLLRVTAWVMRFVDKLKKRDGASGLLTTQELQRAKLYWVLHIQHKHYLEVVSDIKRGKKGNLQAQLNLQIDKNGLLRCHGRISNSDLTQGANEPKLLPKKEYFSKLVVEYYHQKLQHSGVSQTLAQTRQEYWIPQGRALTAAEEL